MGDQARSLLRPGLWVGGGLVVTTAITIIDVAAPESTVPPSAVMLGPFVAALGGTTLGTSVVAAYALAGAIGIAAGEEGMGFWRLATVAALGFAAIALTAIRKRRDAEIVVTRSDAAEARRLRIALEGGSMGTWDWDQKTGRVTWDAQLGTLFGVEPEAFEGTFEAWAALLHPDDREGALGIVADAVERGVPFTFDHRVIWPDGSVHWIEGRGEPIVGPDGQPTGAAGVAIDIDDRRAGEAERLELLDRERDARDQAEASSDALHRLTELSLALSGAATVDEVAAAAVEHGATVLRARYGWLATVDAGAEALVTRAQHGYSSDILDPYLVVPLDMPLPSTEALRRNEAIFIESAEDRRERFPHFAETGTHGSLVTAPIALGGDARAVLAFGYPNARPFTPETRGYILAVIEACSAALRRAVAFEAESSSRARLRTLLTLSEALAGLDDPDEVLATTARLAASRIGRYASVWTVDAEGLRRVSIVHADPELNPVLEQLAALGVDGRELAERVAGGTEPVVVHRTAAPDWSSVPDTTRPLLERLQPTSVMVIPMRITGRTLGVLIIGHDQTPSFGAGDLELAVDMGRRAASAHERASLRRASEEQFEIEHEMVEVLQRSIVPEQLPEIPGAEMAAEYRPAGVGAGVGGDWYDAFELDTGLMLVVGDVAGHGVGAARLMVRVRTAFRAYAVEEDDPGMLLDRVDHLLRTFESHEMVTAVVVRYDPKTGEVAWARAGHLPPLLCDGGGNTRFLDDVAAPPLGTLAKGFETARARLGPGSLLVLYTDGLVERRDAPLDDGLEWLSDRVRAARKAPLVALCNALVEDPYVPQPSPDDICVLALRASMQ